MKIIKTTQLKLDSNNNESWEFYTKLCKLLGKDLSIKVEKDLLIIEYSEPIDFINFF